MSQSVTVYGPNLPNSLTKHGTFVVHATGCSDTKKGVYTSLSGDQGGYEMTEDCLEDLVYNIYSDQLAEGCDYESARQDIHFCACVKLPEKVARGNAGNAGIAGIAGFFDAVYAGEEANASDFFPKHSPEPVTYRYVVWFASGHSVPVESTVALSVDAVRALVRRQFEGKVTTVWEI